MSELSGITYRDAGVDIDAGDELVERIKPLVRRAQRREVLAGIGGFGALVELPRRLPATGAGRRHRRGGHQAAPGDRHRPPRHHRHRPGRDVRQRRGGAGRRAAVLPRLLRDRQAAGRGRRGGRARHRRGLRAGGRGAGGRRDRRDARACTRAPITISPVSASASSRRTRSSTARRSPPAMRSSGLASSGAALQRLLADPQAPRHGQAPRRQRSSRGAASSSGCSHRRAST